jgi:hypothetical protein
MCIMVLCWIQAGLKFNSSFNLSEYFCLRKFPLPWLGALGERDAHVLAFSLGRRRLGLGQPAGACVPRPWWEWRGASGVATMNLSTRDAAWLCGVEPAGPCRWLWREEKLCLKWEKKRSGPSPSGRWGQAGTRDEEVLVWFGKKCDGYAREDFLLLLLVNFWTKQTPTKTLINVVWRGVTWIHRWYNSKILSPSFYCSISADILLVVGKTSVPGNCSRKTQPTGRRMPSFNLS